MDAQDDQHCVELGSAEVQIFSEPKDHSIGDVNPRRPVRLSYRPSRIMNYSPV